MSSKPANAAGNNPANNGKKTGLVVLAVILSILIAASVTVALVVFFSDGDSDTDKNSSSASDVQTSSEPGSGTQSEPDGTGSQPDSPSSIVVNSSYEVTPPDADQYFNEIATVVSKSDAFGSPNVRTESQVYNDFYQRGLANQDITYEYMMNGDLDEKRTISRYSSLNHPVYQTYYTTANNDLWLIVEINGAIMATPVSYNATLESGAIIMLSETDTMTSYDSTTNQFYVIKPKASEIDLKTVGTINAETLENYQLGGN